MSKLVEWLKLRWKSIAAVVAALGAGIVGLLLILRRNDSVVDDLKKVADAKDKEIEAVKKAYEEEKRAHEENERKFKEAMDAVVAQYERANKDLDEKKAKQVKSIIEKHGDDPGGLADELSKVTGFKIILPK